MPRITKEKQKRKDELLAKGLKECGTCGRVLPVEQFNINKSAKDGLTCKCKQCYKQYYQENTEEIKQRNKQYQQEHKEAYRQYHKQYYRENKEELKQYQQQYDKQHYQTPQGQVVKFNHTTKRRQNEEEQGTGINKEQWLEMMNFFDWKCAYSGVSLSKNNRSIDHIIPLSKGGEHEIWNMAPMLANYNFSKQAKNMMVWYEWKIWPMIRWN